MSKYLFLFFWLFAQSVCTGTNYYVQQGNSTSNDGLTPATAVGLSTTSALPNDILAAIQPGDFIYLIGTFTNPSYTSSSPVGVAVDDPRFWHGENTFRINNLNGSAGNYITIKAYNSSTLLKGDGGNIIRVQNSTYLRFEGLNIQGEVDNLPLSVANNLQFVYILNSAANLLDPTAAEIHYRDQDCTSNCTAGAVVDGETYSNLNANQVYRPTYYDTRGMYLSDVKNIDILNNHIHHMPGGGLRVSDCEDILIQGNEINDCSRRSSGGTHGLVVTKATSTRTSDDYRISIVRNLVHHNYNEQYSWAPDKTVITPHIDEGKGISLQRNETTASVNWNHGRILIANNICYYNGFSGIHSNDGDRVEIINNTCYFNSYTGSITIGGTNPNGGNIGISLSGGTGHKIINNIVVIDNNMTRSPISTDITASGAVTVRNNIIYGTTGTVGTDADIDAIQVNTQMVSPLFTDAVAFNFKLLSTSPAINGADAAYAPTTDYYGNARTTPDIGAIEYQTPLPVELLDFSGKHTSQGNELVWQTASEIGVQHFELEKSFEGQKFAKIAEISAQNRPSIYSYLDDKVRSSAYYRLKIKDLDGSVHFSKIIAIQKSSNTPFRMLPNPAADAIQIEITETDFKFTITNAMGQIVQTGKAQPLQPISIKDLIQGLYFVSVQGQVQKFWKQ